MKNLLYALGIAGLGLVPINSYSQETSGYVKEEIIEKNFRKLDEGAKNLALTLVYTNPTSIKFDSLDQKTKNSTPLSFVPSYCCFNYYRGNL